jgi:hypothetical protein
MSKQKKSKEERQREQKIVDCYHQKVTEEALDPKNFQEWKIRGAVASCLQREL